VAQLFSLGALATMKAFVIAAVVLVVLAVIFLSLVYDQSSVDRRAWLIQTKASLKEADMELQKFGAFTNHFPYMTIYPYTNRFIIDGTNYQCEFAAECARLPDRGFLTITTNQLFIWVDKKGGAIPLVGTRFFPP